jgi:hypothetical protein
MISMWYYHCLRIVQKLWGSSKKHWDMTDTASSAGCTEQEQKPNQSMKSIIFWDITPRRWYFSIYILLRVCGDYIRWVLDWQLDLLDHTQLHTITLYTLYNSLQFTITLAESSHCIVTLPVFQYRRIRLPATLLSRLLLGPNTHS